MDLSPLFKVTPECVLLCGWDGGRIDHGWGHKSQGAVVSPSPKICQWEFLWEQQSLGLVFGPGLIAPLFLNFCLVTWRLLGFPVKLSCPVLISCYFMSVRDRKSTDNERAPRPFLSPQNLFLTLVLEKTHSELKWAGEVAEWGLPSRAGWKASGNQVPGAFCDRLSYHTSLFWAQCHYPFHPTVLSRVNRGFSGQNEIRTSHQEEGMEWGWVARRMHVRPPGSQGPSMVTQERDAGWAVGELVGGKERV